MSFLTSELKPLLNIFDKYQNNLINAPKDILVKINYEYTELGYPQLTNKELEKHIAFYLSNKCEPPIIKEEIKEEILEIEEFEICDVKPEFKLEVIPKPDEEISEPNSPIHSCPNFENSPTEDNEPTTESLVENSALSWTDSFSESSENDDLLFSRELYFSSDEDFEPCPKKSRADILAGMSLELEQHLRRMKFSQEAHDNKMEILSLEIVAKKLELKHQTELLRLKKRLWDLKQQTLELSNQCTNKLNNKVYRI